MKAVLTSATAVWLALCLILGGSTAGGAIANMLLQFAALAILGWAAVAGHRRGQAGRLLLLLVGVFYALVLLSVVPLPPAIWDFLPMRDRAEVGLAALAMPNPWLPISLLPQATLASALWVLPAVAMLLIVLRLRMFGEQGIARTIAAVAVVSVVIGALQRAGGPASPAYFYAITNFGVAVGTFANANHLAALLVMTLPFLAAIEASPLEGRAAGQMAVTRRIVLATIAALLLLGIVLSGSLAVIGLVPPVLFASWALLYKKPGRARIALLGTAGLILLGIIALVALPVNLISADAAVSQGTRLEFWRHTLMLIGQSFPVGTGLGTFQSLYPSTENPATITGTYVNHAHNDYLELLLELGLVGILLIGVFLLWWLRRVASLWNDPTSAPVQLAATIATGVLLLHSLVDYPLRTAGLSTVFAMCCALMTGVAPHVVQRNRGGSRHDRSRRDRRR